MRADQSPVDLAANSSTSLGREYTESDLPVAMAALDERPPPLLILMKGHPGSGKSTVARGLARALRCPLVDKDDARDCFQVNVADLQAGGHANKSLQAQASTPPPGATVDWNALSYDIMFQVARTQLQLGLDVVVDCPLARPQLYHRALALSQQCGAEVAVVECWCSDELEWRLRLEQRAQQDCAANNSGGGNQAPNKSHKPGSWQQLQQLLHSYGGCWAWSTDGSITVKCLVRLDTTSTTTAPDMLARSAVQQIAKQLGRAGLMHQSHPCN